MQEEIKFYMLTILKDGNLFANIYENHKDFLDSFNKFKDTYPIRAWELIKTVGEKFDLIVAKQDDAFVACLEPIRKIDDNESDFVKCIKKEIDVSKIKQQT